MPHASRQLLTSGFRGVLAIALLAGVARAAIDENAREARPRHKYSATDFGLTSEGISADFADYHDKYLT